MLRLFTGGRCGIQIVSNGDDGCALFAIGELIADVVLYELNEDDDTTRCDCAFLNKVARSATARYKVR
jgi:hypothetical protein